MRGLAGYRCKFHFYLGDVFVFFLIVAAGGGSAGAAVAGVLWVLFRVWCYLLVGWVVWVSGGVFGVVAGGPGGVWGEGGFTSAFAWFLADMAWV